ncbi:MAG: porin family protein [Fulvivirga sp.]|uniref:porin family protein n=1 Tax=Fulvivirga sp. TaxID=1931237 RepID=UPI0032EE2BDA
MKKIHCLIIFLSVAGMACAQPAYLNKYNSKKPSQGDKFLKTQWWLGFKAGVNLTKATSDATYSGYSPTNYDASLLEKKYDSYDGANGQAGLEITFYHQGFSFSFQPNYRRQTFAYSNAYEWTSSEDAGNTISLNYDQNHKLDFIDLPLIIKYDILKSTKLRPFVQAGFFYSTLVSALKEVEISGEDLASGSAGPFENQTVIIGADNLFIKPSWGYLVGGGVAYDFWNVRLVLDASYRIGLTNITNAQNRYSENQLSGLGDAMDDIQLDNISINFGLLFPLRFISSDGHNAVR